LFGQLLLHPQLVELFITIPRGQNLADLQLTVCISALFMVLLILQPHTT